jgi:hypothetical protein
MKEFGSGRCIFMKKSNETWELWNRVSAYHARRSTILQPAKRPAANAALSCRSLSPNEDVNIDDDGVAFCMMSTTGGVSVELRHAHAYEFRRRIESCGLDLAAECRNGKNALYCAIMYSTRRLCASVRDKTCTIFIGRHESITTHSSDVTSACLKELGRRRSRLLNLADMRIQC